MNKSLVEAFDKAQVPRVLGVKESYWPTIDDVSETVADEKVHQVLRCQVFKKNIMATLVATDNGVHAFQKSSLGFKKYGKGYEFFPYVQLTGVTTSFHATYRTCLEFSRAANVDKFGYIVKEDAEDFVALVRSQIRAIGSQSPSISGLMSPPDPLDRLKKLKELVDAGVISTQEFEEKKNKLMDEI